MGEKAGIFDLSQRLPTDAEIESATHAAHAIASACATNGGKLAFRGENGQHAHLSPSLCELITDVLGHVARGEMVTIISTSALLSTQEAADLLNVSRPFVSKLLKEGAIDHIKVGTHRRVQLTDLMNYKSNRDTKRRRALDEIIEIGEELDI